MPNYKEDAETLRFCMLNGWAAVADAVAWADGVITSSASPDASVIEVALAGRRSRLEVAQLLEDVPGDADSVRVRRRALRRMLHLLDERPDRGYALAHSLYELAVSGELPEDEFGSEPYALEDAFDRTGVCTQRDAVASLRDYLVQQSQARGP